MFRKAKNVIRGRNANGSISSEEYGDSDNEQTIEGKGKFSSKNFDNLMLGDEVTLRNKSNNNTPFG